MNNFDFNASMLNYLLKNHSDDKIEFSEVTNWHSSHPNYRLNYYNGIQISQVLGIYLLFNKDFLSQFDNIIEIGSYNGGLSSYIFDNLKSKSLFISYDIVPELNMVKDVSADMNFVIGDCFEKPYVSDIKYFIKRPGKTLLICDGGHKTKEFETFAPDLKKGDVIILHDYKQDDTSWKEYTDYWQWPYGHETSYEDIKDAIAKNELTEYRNKNFNFFLWGAYIK